jgi:hypothetical protein
MIVGVYQFQRCYDIYLILLKKAQSIPYLIGLTLERRPKPRPCWANYFGMRFPNVYKGYVTTSSERGCSLKSNQLWPVDLPDHSPLQALLEDEYPEVEVTDAGRLCCPLEDCQREFDGPTTSDALALLKDHCRSVHVEEYVCDFPDCKLGFGTESGLQLHRTMCHGPESHAPQSPSDAPPPTDPKGGNTSTGGIDDRAVDTVSDSLKFLTL